MKKNLAIFAPTLLCSILSTAALAQSTNGHQVVKARLEKSAPAFSASIEFTEWKRLSTLPLEGDTWHPQGMKKIGDALFLSSVDKDGKMGHLILYRLVDGKWVRKKTWDFKNEAAKNMIHPGGMDFDGQTLWVPISVYKSSSQSVLLGLNVQSLLAEKELSEATTHNFDLPQDHFGGVIRHGSKFRLVNWGTKKIYTYEISADQSKLEMKSSHFAPEDSAGYMYQDCKSVGTNFAICSGTKGLRFGPLTGDGVVDLIGFNIDGSYRIYRRWKVPVSESSTLSFNAFDTEQVSNFDPATATLEDIRLRFHFAPHDQPNTNVYTFEDGKK